MRKIKYSTIDEYIATFPKEIQERLSQIKNLVLERAPDSIETISYQIPCFKLNGKYLIYFAAFKNHISIYPIPKGSKSFQEKITPFVAGKGTIRFKNTENLPINLIREIIKTAITKNSKL